MCKLQQMEKIYELILLPWLLIALISFISLLKINAPYGKFFSKNFGFSLPYKLGWFIQEIISPLSLIIFYLLSTNNSNSKIVWVFLIIWILHYIYRSIIFPLRMSGNVSRIPIAVILSAVTFNTINGFTNGYYLGITKYNPQYYFEYNFIIGLSLILIGFYINFKADNTLISLKSKNEGYLIPKGNLYKYISCPNYFGEMIEWLGFAIMTLSLPALIFFIWTVANLFPRALATHKWYRNHFNNYPKDRKAIIPFII